MKIKKYMLFVVIEAALLMLVMSSLFIDSYASSDEEEYEKVKNAYEVSLDERKDFTLYWTKYTSISDDEYFKFTPLDNIQYEFKVFNQYGITNANNIIITAYRSAEDAYLGQNGLGMFNRTYDTDDNSKCIVLTLEKGTTYYIKTNVETSDQTKNEYAFMVKKHVHKWQLESSSQASFDMSGIYTYRCKICSDLDHKEYGMITSIQLKGAPFKYTGKQKKPDVKLIDRNGEALPSDEYALEYGENVKAGQGYVIINLKNHYTGTKRHTFEISKANNTLSVKAKTATVKYSKVKKKAQSLTVTKVINTLKKGQGTMSYVKSSGNKKITINKSTGKVTIKKGLKKGTHKVTVKVKAGGNSNYKASSTKAITIKIRIK